MCVKAMETSTEIRATTTDEVDTANSGAVVQTEVSDQQVQATASQVTVQETTSGAQPAGQPAAPAQPAAAGSVAPADIKEGDVFFALATFVSETGKQTALCSSNLLMDSPAFENWLFASTNATDVQGHFPSKTKLEK